MAGPYTSHVYNIKSSAPLYKSSAKSILVLGEPRVGKTTLLSTCLGIDIDPALQSQSAYTIKLINPNQSSVTEIQGLHINNKARGEVWEMVINFIVDNHVDVIWFCISSAYLEDDDEIWHWVAQLLRLAHVILVRTKYLLPSYQFREDVAQHPELLFVSILARDMQLDPSSGGATVRAYGVAALMETTINQCAEPTPSPIQHEVFNKQVKSDCQRYQVAEAQKESLMLALQLISVQDFVQDEYSEESEGMEENDSGEIMVSKVDISHSIQKFKAVAAEWTTVAAVTLLTAVVCVLLWRHLQ